MLTNKLLSNHIFSQKSILKTSNATILSLPLEMMFLGIIQLTSSLIVNKKEIIGRTPISFIAETTLGIFVASEGYSYD